jgi:hypothetical protein
MTVHICAQLAPGGKATLRRLDRFCMPVQMGMLERLRKGLRAFGLTASTPGFRQTDAILAISFSNFDNSLSSAMIC